MPEINQPTREKIIPKEFITFMPVEDLFDITYNITHNHALDASPIAAAGPLDLLSIAHAVSGINGSIFNALTGTNSPAHDLVTNTNYDAAILVNDVGNLHEVIYQEIINQTGNWGGLAADSARRMMYLRDMPFAKLQEVIKLMSTRSGDFPAGAKRIITMEILTEVAAWVLALLKAIFIVNTLNYTDGFSKYIVYDAEEIQSGLAHALRNNYVYANLGGADFDVITNRLLIEEINKHLIQYNIELPIESFARADKYVGYYTMNYPGTETPIKVWFIPMQQSAFATDGAQDGEADILPFNLDMEEGHKSWLIEALRGITALYKSIARYTKIYEYGRAFEDYETVFNRYKAQKLEAIYLTTPAMIKPYPLFLYDTYYNSDHYEVRVRADYYFYDSDNGAGILDATPEVQLGLYTSFHRRRPHNTDLVNTKWYIAGLPGMTEKDILEIITWNSYILWFLHPVASAAAYTPGADVGGARVYLGEGEDPEVLDLATFWISVWEHQRLFENGDLFYTELLQTWVDDVFGSYLGPVSLIDTPPETNIWTGPFPLTNTFYNFNAWADADIASNNPILMWTTAANAWPTNLDRIWSVQEFIVAGNWYRKFEIALPAQAFKFIKVYYLPGSAIHRHTIDEFGCYDYLWNPASKPVDPPENGSGITISSLATATDVGKINQFIAYLESYKAWASTNDKAGEAAGTEKHIDAAKKRLEALSENPDVSSSDNGENMQE